MISAKCSDEDYINFGIATPRVGTATEAGRVPLESENAPAHDAFTRFALIKLGAIIHADRGSAICSSRVSSPALHLRIPATDVG